MQLSLSLRAFQRLQSAPLAQEWATDSGLLELCASGRLRGCGLMQAAGGGAHSFSVFTTQPFETGEPIGPIIGCLRTEAEHASLPQGSLRRLMSWRLPAAALGSQYAAKGGGGLVLEAESCCNEARFIRAVCPACVRQSAAAAGGWCELHAGEAVDARETNLCVSLFGSAAANVQAQIVLHGEYRLPFVVLVAKRRLQSGTELVWRWTEAELREYGDCVLRRLCREGWRLHADIARMQAALRQAGSSDDSVLPPGYRPRPPIPPRELQLLPGAACSSAADAAPPPSAHLVCLTLSSAFARSGAVQLDEMVYELGADTETATQRQIQRRLLQQQAQAQRGQAEETEPPPAKSLRRQQPQRAQARESLTVLSASASSDSRLAAAEVLSCLHPVRFFCPPDRPAFTCVFDRALAAGERVALYHGVCQTQSQRRIEAEALSGPAVCSALPDAYSWDISRGELHIDSALVVAAAEAGGVARFVNDSLWRTAGSLSVNVSARSVVDQDRCLPHVLLSASSEVSAGREAVVSYGESFWQPMRPCLLEMWLAFNRRAAELSRSTAQLCLQLQLPDDAQQRQRQQQALAAWQWSEHDVQYPDHDGETKARSRGEQ